MALLQHFLVVNIYSTVKNVLTKVSILKMWHNCHHLDSNFRPYYTWPIGFLKALVRKQNFYVEVFIMLQISYVSHVTIIPS